MAATWTSNNTTPPSWTNGRGERMVLTATSIDLFTKEGRQLCHQLLMFEPSPKALMNWADNLLPSLRSKKKIR